MSPLAAAYDNIRLMRRKIQIAHVEANSDPSRVARDAAVVRIADLTDDLVRAVQDFADAGYEEKLAHIIDEVK